MFKKKGKYMARMVERNRFTCSKRHVGAFIVYYDDGSFVVKCINIKMCGDECPYLKDPKYKSPFRRAPEYKAK